MAIEKGLAAAAFLMLSLAGAYACDDFEEEMAMRAAQQAAKVVREVAVAAAAGTETAAPVPAPSSEPTSVASVTRETADALTTAN